MEIDSSELETTEFVDSDSPYAFLDVLDISNDVKRRLSAYLKSLLPGSNSVYITPIGDSCGTDNLLRDWDSIFQSKANKMNDVLLSLEKSNKEKYGPRSIRLPWSLRFKSFIEYFDDNRTFTFNPPDLPPKSSLRPISLKRAVSYLKNTTNSGLPFYVKKGSVKSRLLDMTFDDLISKVKLMLPSILFTRTQEGNKTRDVWGYSIYNTLFETMFYIPLLAYQVKLKWRSALVSPELVSRNISEMIFKCKNDPDLVMVSIDFKGFDKTVLTAISDFAFEYIKNLFQTEYHFHIDLIKEVFQSCGIITPSGIYSGKHGVPSGSTFTNEVDSIVQYAIALSSGLVNVLYMQVQGDDGVYLIYRKDLEDLIKVFEECGLKVNLSKSYISPQYCVYLQSLYHCDYIRENGLIGGIYPTYRALCRIAFQERFVNFMDDDLNGIDYYSIRTICILENCKFHPLFEELVTFIYERDKYHLSFSEESISKYVKLIEKGSGTGGVINNQFGDDVRGIMSFETVKIINKLAQR